METRQIEGIVLGDVDAELGWIDGDGEPLAYEILTALDAQAPAHFWEMEEGETVTLTLTAEQWALVDRMEIEGVTP